MGVIEKFIYVTVGFLIITFNHTLKHQREIWDYRLGKGVKISQSTVTVEAYMTTGWATAYCFPRIVHPIAQSALAFLLKSVVHFNDECLF